jgi:hypothetical protein
MLQITRFLGRGYPRVCSLRTCALLPPAFPCGFAKRVFLHRIYPAHLISDLVRRFCSFLPTDASIHLISWIQIARGVLSTPISFIFSRVHLPFRKTRFSDHALRLVLSWQLITGTRPFGQHSSEIWFAFARFFIPCLATSHTMS